MGKSLHNTVPYPKLQAVHHAIQRPNKDTYGNLESNLRTSKRKRENATVIEELARLDMDLKKRRSLPREEPSVGDGTGGPDLDCVILKRKHSVSLHQGLQRHWTCVCHKCSCLSLGLSLPQWKESSCTQTCFEVFFGVRSLLDTTLQEGKITVR